MRVVLINPPVYHNAESITPQYMNHSNALDYPPLGLLYLAANLTGRHECMILDAHTLGMSPEECLARIRSFGPDLVGITTFADSLYCCSVLTQMVKGHSPSIQVVLGGPHASIYPEEVVRWPTVDYVITGFAENTFAALVEALDNKQADRSRELGRIPALWRKDGSEVRRPQVLVDESWDVKKVKRPDRTLLDLDKYFTVANSQKITTMISSRGCPFSCTFCDVPEKRHQPRDVLDIVSEIEEILNLGITQIHFFDDCFNLKRGRVVEMCEAFIEHDLKFEWAFRGRVEPCDDELARLLHRAGCRRVQLGVEGTDQATLDRIKKRINIARVPEVLKIYRANGIETMGYFILGFPFQTYDDCVTSCERIMRMGFDYVNMFLLIPYPRTELYREVLDGKLLAEDRWYEHTLDPQPDFKLGQWHPHIERQRGEGLLTKYYKNFYLSPRFIMSEMWRTKSVNNLVRKAKVALSMMKGSYT